MRNLIFIVSLLFLGSVICLDFENQDKWGGLCQKGQKQSPINIKLKDVQSCNQNFQFDISVKDHSYFQPAYNPQNEKLYTLFKNSYIKTVHNGKEKVYRSIAFVFHHKSEHQIDGKNADLEINVVHQAEDQSLAVFAVLMKAEKGDFPDVFDNWVLDSKKGAQQQFPFDGITPPHVYHYSGSWDIPECMEGVQWFVSGNVLPIKKSTYKHIASLINGGEPNSRDVQKLNHREVYESGKVCASAHSKKSGRHSLSGHHHHHE